MFLILFSIAFALIWLTGVYAPCKTLKVSIDNKRDSHFSVIILKVCKGKIAIFVFIGHFNTDCFIFATVFSMFL